MKVCIIGAGPTGSFAAYHLAKHFDVEIFENHAEVGKPVQCSGLVTQTIRKVDGIFNSEEFEDLINAKINKIRLFSKNEKTEFELKEPDMVLDRERFDKWLAKLAERKGAKLNLNSEFLKFERRDGKLILHIKQQGKVKKIEADFLIGADGFFSQVSKELGNSRDFIPCIQANMAYESNAGAMDIFFSSDYKGLFAWIVPKNANTAEVGLGCKEKPTEKFREFLKKRKINGKILSHTGGPISRYNPSNKIANGNVFLIGEAASFVKSSTLGGIIPSLNSAKAIANSLINGTIYERETKELRREMRFHNLARKVLDRFSDADYDSMLRLCNKKEVKDLIKEDSRDEASNNFRWKLLKAQPLFAKFLFKVFA